MSNLVFKNADETLAITVLTPEFIEACGGVEKALVIEAHRVKPNGVIAPDALEVARNIQLPSEQERNLFRAAWRWIDNEPKINICPNAARTCIQNKLRQERETEFTKLDIAYQRADEENNWEKKAELAKKKQALRDAPDKVPTVPEGMTIATPEFLDVLAAVTLESVTEAN